MNGSRNWLIRGLSTSVGQKLVMGVTGLALCGFLVVHLAGNLLLFKSEKAYDEYAHALHSNELLPLAEAGLFGLFVLHIWLAFTTTRQNTAARPIDNAMRESKKKNLPGLRPETFMFWSGLVILGFLILHIADMKLGRDGAGFDWSTEMAPAAHTLKVLRDPVSAAVYFVASFFVGLHTWHGVRSACQTLGFRHPKYTPAIEVASVVFGFVMAAGFASLAFYFHVFHGKP